MPAASYDPQKQSLGQILNTTDPPVQVPPYQRDYSWKRSNVEDFWNDLLRFHRQFPDDEVNGKEYFLGSAVLVRTSSRRELLDGQQRLATATILLSSLRDKLRPSNANAANQIDGDYIVKQDALRNNARTYKLELNAFDRDFFRAWIQETQGATLPAPGQRSHKLIRGARDYFDTKIVELIAGMNPADAIQLLMRLSRLITANFGFVVVTSSDGDHAASIFETLNDRGIGLSTADLLRSWLLTAAGEPMRDEALRLWTEILQVSKQMNPDLVIRVSWVSRNGDVKSRSLYKEIKDKLVAAHVDALTYTRELHVDALIYRKLVRAATGDAVVDEVCKGLQALKAGSCFAPLLAASRHYQPRDLATVAKAIACLAVRHNLICRKDPGHLENKAFEVAKEITAGGTAAAAVQSLRQLSPTDTEFQVNFDALVFKPTQHTLVQVLLRTIENNRQNTGEKIIASRKRVHIEHIYPQNPQAGNRWPDHDVQVYRLGNLTLLGAALNQAIQNGPFPQKAPSYQQSAFLITQQLASLNAWDSAAITSRQQTLRQEALSIWPSTLA